MIHELRVCAGNKIQDIAGLFQQKSKCKGEESRNTKGEQRRVSIFGSDSFTHTREIVKCPPTNQRRLKN